MTKKVETAKPTAPKLPFWKRWHDALMKNRLLRGGILAVILVTLGLTSVTLAYQLWKPASIAKFLPATQTVAYVEFDLEKYESAVSGASEEFKYSLGAIQCQLTQYLLSTDCFWPEWVGNQAGIAWLQTEDGTLEPWVFLEAANHALAEEVIEQSKETEIVVQMQHGYLMMGPSEENLSEFDAVETGEVGSLKKDPDFAKMRPHLAYNPAAFFYAKPSLSYEFFVLPDPGDPFLGLWTEYEWEFDVMGDLIRWFPAMGLAVSAHESGLNVQTYFASDKSPLGNDAFFHLDEKYTGELIGYLPEGVTKVLGGQDLGITLDQLSTLLNAMDGVSGLILEGMWQERLATYFGDEYSLEDTYYTLFENEYAMGWVDNSLGCELWDSLKPCPYGEEWVLLIELDEESTALVESLNESLLSRGLVQIDEESSTLYQISLEMTTLEQRDMKFNVIKKEDTSDLFQFMVYEDILFLTTQEAEMKNIINALLDSEGSYSDTAEYALMEELVVSSDHVMSWPFVSGINLFDDGISTFHIVEFY